LVMKKYKDNSPWLHFLVILSRTNTIFLIA